MSTNNLIKDFGPTVYSPGSPGTPGQAAQPARTVYQTTTGPIYGIALIDYYNADTNTVEKKLIDTVRYGTITTAINYPALPYIPPSPGTAPSTVVGKNEGWNAGARSIGVLAGDGAAKFSVLKSTIGAVVGLNTQSPPAYDYREVQHGLYFVNGLFSVIERGTERTARQPFADADVFALVRTASVVRYYRNNVLLYTSNAASLGTAFLDAALYSGGDTVTAASLAATVPAELGGHGSASVAFLPLGSKAGKSLAQGRGEFLPLRTQATAARPQGAVVAMAPLQALAGRRIAQGSAAFQPLKVTASGGLLVPRNNSADNALPYLMTAAQGMTGTVGKSSTVLAPMTTMASNRPYGTSSTRMQPLTGAAAKLRPVQGYADLAAPGGYQLDAAGAEQPANKFTGQIRGILTANGGGYAALRGVKPTLTVAATIGTTGNGAMALPMPSLTASGTAGSVGKAVLSAPMPTLAAGSGAVLSVQLYGFQGSVTASGMTGAVGKLVAELPLFTLVASGTTNGLSEAHLSAPMLVPVPSGRAMMLAPHARLVAVGRAIVAIATEAYAMNLQVDEGRDAPNPTFAVSHYSQYPFSQVIKHNGRYYGVGLDGLYLLEGDTDAGAPIPWSMKTGLSDFKTKQFKRVASAYIGGRLDTQAVVGVTVGEAGENTYQYKAVRGRNAQSYRVTLGRGVRSRYYGFSVSDPTGHRSEVHTLDLEIDVLERAI